MTMGPEPADYVAVHKVPPRLPLAAIVFAGSVLILELLAAVWLWVR